MDKDTILRQAAKAAEQMNGQPPPSPVQPQPSPVAFQIAQGQMPDGSLAVIFVANTVTGQTVLFIDPATARSIAAGLEKAAAAAASGLVLPG